MVKRTHISGFWDYIKESEEYKDKIESVKKFISDNSYFRFNQYTKDIDTLIFTTRENGNVGEEEASDVDIEEGRKLRTLLKKEFPDLKVSMEVVDEWVDVNVSGFRGKLYDYFYTYAIEEHYSDGSVYIVDNAMSKMYEKNGYGGIEYRMNRAEVDYHQTFDMDYEEVVKRLEAITDYPYNHKRKSDAFSYKLYEDSEKILIREEHVTEGEYYESDAGLQTFEPYSIKTFVYKSRLDPEKSAQWKQTY